MQNVYHINVDVIPYNISLILRVFHVSIEVSCYDFRGEFVHILNININSVSKPSEYEIRWVIG